MKARTLFLALAATMLFVACGDKEEQPDNNNNNNNGGGEGGGGEVIDSPALAGFDENGASIATFSVGEGVTVRFSRGNLQYRASTGTWRFAEQQYDIVKGDNDNISPTYSGWIDLFGYGTSGWNSGAVAYQPYSNSHNPADYCPNGSPIDLTGDNAQADWGVHNPIANGGNTPGMWRTLTRQEWEYLISPYYATNETRLDKNGLATVMGHQGLVILPDSFTLPEGLDFVPGDSDPETLEITYNNNVYDETAWRSMEAAGAVFLPAAEMRGEGGTDVIPDDPWYVGTGSYWTSTGTQCASAISKFGFGNAAGGIGFGCTSGSNGYSVRLVRVE